MVFPNTHEICGRSYLVWKSGKLRTCIWYDYAKSICRYGIWAHKRCMFSLLTIGIHVMHKDLGDQCWWLRNSLYCRAERVYATISKANVYFIVNQLFHTSLFHKFAYIIILAWSPNSFSSVFLGNWGKCIAISSVEKSICWCEGGESWVRYKQHNNVYTYSLIGE